MTPAKMSINEIKAHATECGMRFSEPRIMRAESGESTARFECDSLGRAIRFAGTMGLSITAFQPHSEAVQRHHPNRRSLRNLDGKIAGSIGPSCGLAEPDRFFVLIYDLSACLA